MDPKTHSLCQCWSIGQNKHGDQANGHIKPVTKLEIIKTIPNNIYIKDIINGSGDSVYLLLDDNTFIVFGNNSNGQLGLQKTLIKRIIYNWYRVDFIATDIINSIIMFIEFDEFSGHETTPIIIDEYKIKYISNGVTSFHRFLLTKDNKLYGAGNNCWSTLGIVTEQENVYNFREITYFNDNNIRLKEISCSWKYSIFLSDDGRIFSCGESYNGGLGLDDVFESNKIELIDSIKDKIITNIVCGSNHCLALTKGNKVYSFGNNHYGQLGHGHTESIFVPTLLQYFCKNDIKIVMVTAGQLHSMALDVNGRVYCFGNNRNGQCSDNGYGNYPQQIPKLNLILQNKEIVSMRCGGYHNIVYTKDKQYYLWGSNKYNQCLVYNDKKSLPIATKYDHTQDFAENCKIIAIYPGYMSTKIVTLTKS